MFVKHLSPNKTKKTGEIPAFFATLSISALHDAIKQQAQRIYQSDVLTFFCKLLHTMQ